MKRTRVVITGFSAITPLATSAMESWNALLAGKSGIGQISLFDATGYDATIAGEVKNFDPASFGISPKQTRHMDRFVQFGASAALELMRHSRYKVDESNAERIGVMVGVGLGGLHTIEQFHTKLMTAGPNRVSPFMIPMLISNMAPGYIAILTGCKGANMAITSACASSTHAISSAFSEILLGRYDAMITGGIESTISPMGVSGFTAMKALCADHNDDPEHSSRPFDKNRSGFVMGEGAGLLLLESLDSALRRGADIYAEIVGIGASADAHHMTAPEASGSGMAAAMRRALEDAGVAPDEVDHINAHGTSTHLNDLCETIAIKKVFGKHAYDIPITANKSQVGHLLGAAGGVEAIFSVLSLHTGMIPGIINYETPDPECDLAYVTGGPRQANPNYVLSNSFGFGGTNGSILFKKYVG